MKIILSLFERLLNYFFSELDFSYTNIWAWRNQRMGLLEKTREIYDTGINKYHICIIEQKFTWNYVSTF
jgi:hypothetical protein